MKTEAEIEAAAERAARMQNRAQDHGSRFFGMTYEDGLREGLDWVMDNSDEDPTQG